MKKKLTFLLLCLMLDGICIQAQVSINTSGLAPHSSAMLDISSTSKGLLIPRMTLTEMQAIINPAGGLLVYNTTNQAIYTFNGSAWKMLKASNPSAILDGDGNTSVDVEFSPNNDMIYFKLGGFTKMILKSNRLELINDNNNVFIGEYTGQSNYSGTNNTAVGEAALINNYHGGDNVAIGYHSLLGNIDGIKNTAVGFQSLTSSYGSFNVAVGASALNNNSSGNSNTAIGTSALYSNQSGYFNTAGGTYALYYNVQSNNSAFGRYALYSNTNGYQNTAVGSSALQGNISGFNNTAMGYSAMFSTSDGDENTAYGVAALYYNISGNNNSAIGREALRDNTSSDNTALGFHAALMTTSGIQNVALGANALVNNTTGSYHTAVGYNTGPNSSNLFNTTCIGIDATATGNDMVRIGNIYVGSIGGQVNWTTLSDERFKENVREEVPGLSFINQLRPVTYQVNRNKVNDFIRTTDRHAGDQMAYSGDEGRISLSEKTTGFIAQEVEAAAQTLGFEFSGVDTPDNENDYYGLRYAEFVVPLVKAVQELSATNDMQQKLIVELSDKNREMERKIAALEGNYH